MVDPVVGGNRAKRERIDALQAAYVVAVLVRAGSALVVRVDTAVGAEVVLRSLRVELIELEGRLALDDPDSRERHRSDDGALSPADRAITTPRVDDSVRKVELKNDCSAVARRSVLRLDFGTTDVLDHA